MEFGHLLLVVIICISTMCYTKELRVKRDTRSRRQRLNNQNARSRQALQNMLSHENLAAFTPPPLLPSEVECQVGVEETVFHDGRCISLGSSQRHACQSGRQLELYNNECVRQSGSPRAGRRTNTSNRRRQGSARSSTQRRRNGGQRTRQ
ncbi:hypothetical protein SNE40_005538 [Patella caerulea]